MDPFENILTIFPEYKNMSILTLVSVLGEVEKEERNGGNSNIETVTEVREDN